MTTETGALSYMWFVEQAADSIHTDDLSGAADMYLMAAHVAERDEMKAWAYMQQGIALCDNDEYSKAHAAFNRAAKYAMTTDKVRFSIERGDAIVYMHECCWLQALDKLMLSYKGFVALDESAEAGLSLSYIGRVKMHIGEPAEALELMGRAHKILRKASSRRYELDNLRRILEIEGSRSSLRHQLRYIWLTKHVGEDE